MGYCQKIVTTFAGKKAILLLTAAFFTLSGMTAKRANFSGKWKLNEAKSEIAQFKKWCVFGGGDRMRSKTMKIARQANFLTVESSSSYDGVLDTRLEKLTFDGKENEATFVGHPRKESTAKWSDNGQTMTVSSVKNLDLDGGKETEIKVTEVWKLINDGKSISLEVNLHSTHGDYPTKLVYDKAS